MSRHTFGELVDAGALFVSDGYRAKNEELGGDGPIFLRAGHVTDTHIDFNGVERFHSDLLPQVAQKMSLPGDVIVTTKGNSTGRVAFVTDDLPRFVYSPHLSFWRSLNTDRIVSGFLRYWSRGPEFRAQLSGLAASTDMAPYLSLADQRRLKITLPGTREQQAVAEILGNLDNKIDLERRMSQTLESMSRALFKSWFIDFEPVREKHPLFPGNFEPSAMGYVPQGWKVSSIGQEVRALGGSTPNTAESSYWGGSFRFATPKDMSALSAPFLLETERAITEEGLQKIGSGLLPAGTVLLSSRAPIGYLAIAAIPTAINQGIIAMICDNSLPNYYVLEWTRFNLDVIVGNANGTTFPEISKRNFRPIPILVPPPQVLDRFVSLVDPLYERVLTNLEENRTLAALRDTLLPKLLSGEVRVKQAEKMVGEAV